VKRSSFSPKYGSREDLDLAQELREIATACNHFQFSLQFVVHGDPCAPNLMVDEESGTVTGCIDLGAAGLSDNHWDLAIAAWSVAHNTDAALQGEFLEEYERSLPSLAPSHRVDREKLSLMYRLARFLL
jgi:aminoglycoside phosphotransferase